MGMKAPITYAEWVSCFELFLEGSMEETVLQAMEKGSFEWTAGISEHFARRMTTTVESRLDAISRQMTTDFARLNGQETALVRGLLDARRRYAVLHRLVQLPVLPNDVQEQLSDILRSYVKQTQQSLEDSAKSDRTGQLRMVIKNNPLTIYDQVNIKTTESASGEAETKRAPGSGPTPRRRVILR